jgi:Zn-dependent peptidase ImmA (M78 family)
MKWIPDSRGPFPQRLWFAPPDGLDLECQRLLEYSFFKRFGRKFSPPLEDEALQVLIEMNADLDLYSSLPPNIEAQTDFKRGKRPVVRVNEHLSSDPNRRHRLRTTLAHEWFHAIYHQTAWELRWAHERLAGNPTLETCACSHSTILNASEDEWLEFQAGYASCAILIPLNWLMTELPSPVEITQSQMLPTLITQVASRFDVSEQAAHWRLRHRKFMSRERKQQLNLF